MTKQALRALRQSIKKWEAIADGTNDELPTGRNCPLCDEFRDMGCTGCPVAEQTGLPACEKTPYNSVAKAHILFARKYKHSKYLRNAKRELDFLKSLLPPPEPTTDE